MVIRLTGLVLVALAFTGTARADDAALATKLDAIEKRLAHIEAMEQARGPKPPFAFVAPNTFDPRPNCKNAGYAMVTTAPAPSTVPNATTFICYEPGG